MGVPDFMLRADAVLADDCKWRDRHDAPDYSKANRKFAQERSKVWEAGSLPDLVSNLVKNWEKEASYKVDADEWRTIDPKLYSFACNGGPKQSVQDMLRLGTYNALIGETALYSAKDTGFETSHEVFRNAMPDGFAWEVLEVWSGPPEVAFKGWLEADPSNETIEIFGSAVASVTPEFKITRIEIFYDPADIMNQMMKNKKSPALEEETLPGAKAIAATTLSGHEHLDPKA